MRGGSVSKILFVLLLAIGFLAPFAQAARDPTQPPPALSPAGGDAPVAVSLRLQAIVLRPGNSRAIINGQSLKAGEQLDGVRVLAIQPRSVLVECQGRRELLRLAVPVIFTHRVTP